MIPELIQQNFANPLGLTALLSLIPLIIFYLVKPKPERQVMPSMTFFAEEKQEGKIRSALRKLKANRLLLLHILLVAGAAAAIANPLIPGINQDGSSVIVLDASASMTDNEEQVKNFASKHLAQSNTVIRVGSQTEVLGTELSKTQAKNIVNNYQASMTSTNLLSALRTASNFEGKLVIASDIDHNEGNIEDFQQTLSPQRAIKTMDLDHENSHGFTDLRKTNGEITAEITNFEGLNKSLEVRKPGENIQVTIGPYYSKEVVLDLQSGTHEVLLPSDEFSPDNTLYVSIPEDQKIRVKQLGSTNGYFETAVELINSTENVQGNTLSNADIYYVSEDFEITDERLEKLSQFEDEGIPLIFEERSDLPSFAPVENRSGVREVEVRLDQQPVTFFRSNVTRYDVLGNALAQPREAFVLSKDGDVLLSNVEPGDFGKEITYPIFWKDTLLNMADTQTFTQLNLQTGQEKVFNQEVEKNGETYTNATLIDETGFYKGRQTYASNLLNTEESKPFTQTTKLEKTSSNKLQKGPTQKHLLSLLAVISMLEILYLSKRGAFR